MSNDVAYLLVSRHSQKEETSNLHPGVPVLGDAVKVAVKAPYDCSPVFGIVH
jgi:hypothetical protein